MPLFAGFVDSVLSGSFVRFVHVESAPATVVGYGRNGEKLHNFSIVVGDVLVGFSALPEVTKLGPFVGHD